MQTSPSGWWYAVNQDGDDGWVPSNYLQIKETTMSHALEEQKQQSLHQTEPVEAAEQSHSTPNIHQDAPIQQQQQQPKQETAQIDNNRRCGATNQQNEEKYAEQVTHSDHGGFHSKESILLREHIWKMRHPNNTKRETLWPPNAKSIVTSLKGYAMQTIFEWESDTTWFRAYQIEVQVYTGFHCVLDFTGTTNHDIQGMFALKENRIEAPLQPFELETICLVSRHKMDPYKFSVVMSWTTSDIHPAIKDTALALNAQRIKSEYEMMRNVGIETTDDVKAIKHKLQSAQIQFVDLDFYPSFGALYIGNDTSRADLEEVMWRRSHEFCQNPVYFEAGIDPEDIQQGCLGDSWFASALSAMAVRPQLVERLFVTKDGGTEGIHIVNVWHNGKREEVIIDDYFPCRLFGGPMYTSSGCDSLWVSILEKAFAKIYGCYARLISGSPYYSFADLTGNPTEIYDLNDEEVLNDLWPKLLSWNLTEDNLMSVASDSRVCLRNIAKTGMMPDHSYTIMDARESAKLNIKLIQLSNPWGHGEWVGDWSDFSPKWTQQIKNELGIGGRDPDDGIFWMSWNDFLKYFTDLTICHCRRDWIDARCSVTFHWDFKNKQLTTNPIKLIIPDGGVVEWIAMFQTDIREQNAPSYLSITALIFKVCDENKRVPIGYIECKRERQMFQQFGSDSSNYHMINALESGAYIIVPFTTGRNWEENSGDQREITMSCHALQCHGLDMSICDEVYCKNDFDKAFMDMALALGQKKQWNELERRHLQVGQLDLFVGRNSSQNKTLLVSMCGDLDNIWNAFGYSDLSDTCHWEIKPKQCVIFGVQVLQKSGKTGFSTYKYRLKTKHLEREHKDDEYEKYDYEESSVKGNNVRICHTAGSAGTMGKSYEAGSTIESFEGVPDDADTENLAAN